MEKQANWWEPIFSGELEIGLKKEKLEDLEQESFLYYESPSTELETQV